MRRIIFCCLLSVCLLLPALAGCAERSDPNIPKSYFDKEEYFQDGGCQDRSDYCIYYYHLDEFENNSRYEVMDQTLAARVRGYFGNFSQYAWMDKYRFDPSCINAGDYVRIETRCADPAHETYKSYTVYYADRETNTLYCIFNDG